MGGGGVGLGCRVVVVRVDVKEGLKFFVKIQTNRGGGGGGGRSGGGHGAGGCGRRIEVFMKIQKQNRGGGVQGGCER